MTYRFFSNWLRVHTYAKRTVPVSVMYTARVYSSFLFRGSIKKKWWKESPNTFPFQTHAHMKLCSLCMPSLFLQQVYVCMGV